MYRNRYRIFLNYHYAVEKSMVFNFFVCRCGSAFCYYCRLKLSGNACAVNEHRNCYNYPPY